MTRWTVFAMVIALAPASLLAQSMLADVKAETNPGKRAEMAIEMASKALDAARQDYQNGNTAKGDADLQEIDALGDECLSSVAAAHKAKFWKNAELKVRELERRVSGLVDDLSYNERAKAVALHAHLDQIHDKLIAGVMRK